MAVATYSTDLALIDDAQDVTSYSATGGGASGLNDETDYFINDSQCISKNGFTATQKGMVHDDVSAPTITAGDAVFIWGRQANRNILDTVANSGGAVIMGTSNTVFAGYNVDGNNVPGSNLLSWVSYAVDPTQTQSYSSGSPGAASTWDHFGMEWAILGSGSLKGAPNAVGNIRHGRELRVINGQAAAYGTFTDAGAEDATITNRWGILTPITGGYLFHGAFVMGQSGTSTDFRDSNQSILVLDDPFVPAGFNEFEIQNASSNVEWTNIKIEAIGTVSPFLLTLNVGTFTGDLCTFVGADTTTFTSTSTCTNSTWDSCEKVTANEADLSGSSFLTPSVAADDAAVQWDETLAASEIISELDNCIFEQGTAAHHAITFGTGVDEDITLTGIEFTGFDGTDDANGSTVEFLATTGSLNLNLVNCTVDGATPTDANFGIDDAAGITVTLVVSPVTVTVNVTDEDGTAVQNARVFVETAATAASGESFELVVTSITQSAGTATCTCSAVHGLETGDLIVIRCAQPDGYNRVATCTVTSTTVFTYPVDSGLSSPATQKTSPSTVVDAQDETSYDNSPTTEGVFSAGFGYNPAETITLDNNIIITVDATNLSAVQDFTVDSTGQTGDVSSGTTLTQVSTSGTGSGFTLTVDDDNVANPNITMSYVAIQELTTAGGVADVTRTFGADQTMKGWARKKNASAPFYKDGNINFTVNKDNGNTVNVTLQDDE